MSPVNLQTCSPLMRKRVIIAYNLQFLQVPSASSQPHKDSKFDELFHEKKIIILSVDKIVLNCDLSQFYYSFPVFFCREIV